MRAYTYIDYPLENTYVPVYSYWYDADFATINLYNLNFESSIQSEYIVIRHFHDCALSKTTGQIWLQQSESGPKTEPSTRMKRQRDTFTVEHTYVWNERLWRAVHVAWEQQKSSHVSHEARESARGHFADTSRTLRGHFADTC